MKKSGLFIALLALAAMSALTVPCFASMSDYSATPPFVLRGADANVLLNLSIETPMQGAAYNDQPNDANGDGDTTDALDCGGRVDRDGGSVGICYFRDKEYVGIFDPNKCYTYSAGRFVPDGLVINTHHECSSKWSGNFLNWATMTAIDEFRWALTGGNRVVDNTSETVLQRANMGLSYGHSWYPIKYLSSSDNVDPSTVTPFSSSEIFIYNHGYQFDVGTERNGASHMDSHNLAQNLNVRVKVCDPSQGLEENCVDYGGYYKPEGLIQRNASKMRFALMGYALDNTHARDGGVLRANMKYVGPTLPDGTANTKKEYGTDGIFIANPEGAPEGQSGVINYLNKFGANGYKSYDPVGELFYECLNYYKNRGPTPEYIDGDLSAAGIQPMPAGAKDGFPVVTVWEDPIQYWCQKNYIVGINDANPWNDKQLPGTFFTNSTFNGRNLNDSGSGYDWGEPSNADPDINVTNLTNTVGDLEGLTGTSQCVGCTAADCDMSSTDKIIPGLGEIMGTCPYPPKENSYYVAGLAYYANTQDIRPLLQNRQTVTTFMIDTQEYNATPLTGQMNMLWLTGKYGGFVEQDFNDTNSDGNAYEPNLASEWDANGDGEPDNYVLATEPKKLVDGLSKAFTDILKRASSGTAASVISNTRAGEGAVYQSIFYPYYNDSNCNNAETKEVAWVGEVHALFVDSYGNMREDTNSNRTLDPTTDKIVIFDGTDVYMFTDSNGNGKLEPGEFTDSNGNGVLDDSERGTPVTLNSIHYLWSSNTWLNDPALVTTTQRSAYDALEHRRYLFTFVDSDGDMVAEADGSEQIPFTVANKATIGPYLHLFTPFEFSSLSPPPGIITADYAAFLSKQSERVINFIRGEDQGSEAVGTSSNIPTMRNRLGDIVHSTPTVVGRPAENYDLLYRDDTYRVFYSKYRRRRSVVYVGGNDGMLHAFNGGFYDAFNKRFDLKSPGCTAPNCETEFPLGTEMWAYVPLNLLPHLYWLTDPNYAHIYYVDLKPRVFDAKIFNYNTSDPANDKHPYGWGTILVSGMRLGGGMIGTDKDHDGTFDATTDVTMKSAYFVLDITDPESPPEVLAEITFDGLGFTTSYPTVAVMKSTTDPATPNKWYLVLGSGPIGASGPDSTALEYVSSGQHGKIYMIDLGELAQNRVLKDQSGAVHAVGGTPFQVLPDNNSYISDLVSVDLDLDYKTDVIYYGTVAESGSSWVGKLRRIVLADDTDPGNWTGNSTLIDVDQPVSAAPAIARDGEGHVWVYFGTGRFMNRDDVDDTSQQSYYAIKEPWNNDTDKELTWATVLTSNLADVTGAEVFEGGNKVDNLALADFDENSNGTV
ncbi:MAG: hypothetical protein JRI89_16210, partial [Deltaproteobacteria bacterium]|nr:hypothetical protein [Deltaproteobacteria bacterium]